MEQTAKIYTLHGMGRDAATRIMRKQNRTMKRVVRVGDHVIRPGRYVHILDETLAANASAVLAAAEAGYLRVLIGTKPLSNAELRDVLYPKEGAVDGDESETTSGDEDGTGLLEEEKDPPAVEPEVETKPAEDSAETSTDVADEPGNEASSVAEPEPAAGRQLPEGWRSMTKKQLLALFEAKAIPMPEKKNVDTLVLAAEAWLKG